MFPANNRDIIAMHFFGVLNLLKSFVTHFFNMICMDYCEKILTKTEARFLLKLSPLITLGHFLVLIALIDVSEDLQS